MEIRSSVSFPDFVPNCPFSEGADVCGRIAAASTGVKSWFSTASFRYLRREEVSHNADPAGPFPEGTPVSVFPSDASFPGVSSVTCSVRRTKSVSSRSSFVLPSKGIPKNELSSFGAVQIRRSFVPSFSRTFHRNPENETESPSLASDRDFPSSCTLCCRYFSL